MQSQNGKDETHEREKKQITLLVKHVLNVVVILSGDDLFAEGVWRKEPLPVAVLVRTSRRAARFPETSIQLLEQRIVYLLKPPL